MDKLVMDYKKYTIEIEKRDGLYYYNIAHAKGKPFLKCCEKFVAQETACRKAMSFIDKLG